MDFKTALQKFLSSSDEVSFGRTMSFIAFMMCLGWDTFFVGFAAHKLDLHLMNIHDILPTSEQLQSQLYFCAGTYGINKFTELASAFANWRKQ